MTQTLLQIVAVMIANTLLWLALPDTSTAVALAGSMLVSTAAIAIATLFMWWTQRLPPL